MEICGLGSYIYLIVDLEPLNSPSILTRYISDQVTSKSHLIQSDYYSNKMLKLLEFPTLSN